MQGVIFLVKTVSVIHLKQSGLLLVSSYLELDLLALGKDAACWMALLCCSPCEMLTL